MTLSDTSLDSLGFESISDIDLSVNTIIAPMIGGGKAGKVMAGFFAMIGFIGLILLVVYSIQARKTCQEQSETLAPLVGQTVTVPVANAEEGEETSTSYAISETECPNDKVMIAGQVMAWLGCFLALGGAFMAGRP